MPKKTDNVETTVQHQTGAVVLTNAYFRCTNCKKMKPAQYFGLRKIEGKIRNQAQCGQCRSQYHKANA